MKNQSLYFKVRYGFKSTDFISIEAGGELEKAIYAWTMGKIVQIGDRMVNGNNIIAIEPHYHRYTGWYESYEPKTGDDFAQIERDCPKFDGIMGYFRERVQYLMNTGKVEMIGKGVDTPLQAPQELIEPPKS